MKDYNYLMIPADAVDSMLAAKAKDGWTVHTIHRNHNATVVDILLERESRPGRD